MKIAICSDHRGYKLKTKIIEKLLNKDYKCVDCGCFSEERCDYPVYAFKLGKEVAGKECEYGIAICGSGDGMVVATNKVKGVRSSCCRDVSHVVRAKSHDDINVLVLASEECDENLAIEMIETFINTKFLGERYEERVKMIEAYEQEY